MRYIYLLLLVMAVQGLYAQRDSLPVLHEASDAVLIEGKKLPALSTLLSSQIALGQQLSSDITQQSSVYLKSYGPGSLSTLSVRGGTAQQTLVQWEGVPILNPMVGLMDLSILSGGLFDQLSLDLGGHCAEQGSGAICGVLDLESSSLSDFSDLSVDQKLQRLSAGVGYGSYGQRSASARALLHSGTFTFSSRLQLDKADNDFPYALGTTEKILTNADHSSLGVLSELSYRRPHNTLKISYWFQDMHRGIPPTTVQTRSLATQDDRTHRVKLDFKNNKTWLALHSTLAFMDEQNNFDDPERLIAARNRFRRYHLTSQATTLNLWRSNLFAKVSLSRVEGLTESYDVGAQSLDQAALILGAKHNFANDKTYAEILLRQEWASNARPPLSPSLHLRHGRVALKLSRDFRLPGLNDLFWRPGGNPLLQPEQGWSQELSINMGRPRLQASASLYHRKLDNWILWLPIDNSFIWGADNVGSVRSYGVEIDGVYRKYLKRQLLTLSATAHLGRSIHNDDVSAQGIKTGDQLIYTPVLRGTTEIMLSDKSWKLKVSNRYTSSVSGINEDLEGFFITDLHLSYDMKMKNLKLGHILSLEINNLWDLDYRVIERRPMPGRTFRLNWTINLNNIPTYEKTDTNNEPPVDSTDHGADNIRF